jgi:flagellar biogenesis protein FliO
VYKNFLLVLLSLTSISSAWAEEGTSIPSTSELLGRAGSGLAIALAVFSIGIYIVKKTKLITPVTNISLKVLEKLSISSKTTLMIVEVRGVEYIVLTGSENSTLYPTVENIGASSDTSKHKKSFPTALPIAKGNP